MSISFIIPLANLLLHLTTFVDYEIIYIMYRNKQWLQKKYFNEKLLMSEIGSLCNVQSATIHKWFKRFGFKGRTPSERHMGKWNGKWKGGKYIRHHSKDHYIRIIRIDGKPVKEHRFIMEKKLGRKLLPQETIHHLDGNSLNNKINNLLLLPSNSAHRCYEATLQSFAKQILFGKHKPPNHPKLLSLFNQMLLKCGQNISI